MHKFCLIHIFFVCALAFCGQNAECQDIADTTKSYNLSEIQVTGKKVTAEIIPPRKLAGETLKNLSTLSVADAVRFFSGIQVKDYGGIGGLKTVNIRSMGTNQMGVFYDGIQIGNAQNGQVDLGRFSLDNIESISLYNGQKASMLQSAKDYGSAGTIYIQTARPQFAINKRFNFFAKLKSGSFGLINPSLLWQQKIKNVSLSVSAEFIHAHGRYKFHFKPYLVQKDTILTRINADITSLRTEAALFGNLRDGEWKIQFYNYHSERGLAGHIAKNITYHTDRQSDNNFFTQASFHKKLKKYAFLIKAKYANDFIRYFPDNRQSDIIFNDYRQNEVYFSVANSYHPFRFWEMALSADIQYNTLAANTPNFAFPQRLTGLAAFSTLFKWQIAKIQTSILATFVDEKAHFSAATPQKPQFTPAVTAILSPLKHFPLDFRAFCKRIFRMPAFNDLYYSQVASYLKPEFVQQYNFGAEYILLKNNEQKTGNRNRFVQNLNVSADIYYNYVENKIAAVPTNNAFRWQMMNLGKVKIFGADISADIEFALAKNWNLNVLVNYSFQNARDFSDKNDTFYKNLIPYSPKHCVTAAFNLAYKKFRFNYCFLFTGERYNSRDNIPANYVVPFQTHDISTAYSFKITSAQITVNVDINNIFNQHYEVVLNYPMPSTNFKIGIKLEI
jgi:outer membrane cobalamin receptor